MLYGLETVTLTKKTTQEAELEVAELKMRFSLGVTRLDEIKNYYLARPYRKRTLASHLKRKSETSLPLNLRNQIML